MLFVARLFCPKKPLLDALPADIKNPASICEAVGTSANTPVTLQSPSPIVLLLINNVLLIGDSLPNIFAAIASLITTEFGFINAVAGSPSLNLYVSTWKKVESATNPFVSKKDFLLPLGSVY